MHMSKRERGFSMLELLVVMLITLVVTAMAIPTIISIMEGARISASANLVSGKLFDARVNAIKRNRAVWVRMDNANRRCVVETLDAGGLTMTVGTPEPLSSGVAFGAGTPGQVTFDPMGRLPAGANQVVVLQVTRTGQRKSVTVTPIGRITIN